VSGVFRASTSLRSRRWLIAALILPALLLRAAIPAGFMPAMDARHGLVLEICPGVASPGVEPGSAAGHAHHHHGDSTPRSHDGLCPFALSAGPALASSFVFEPAAGVLAVFDTGGPLSTRIISTLERAQSARGPPLTNWI